MPNPVTTLGLAVLASALITTTAQANLSVRFIEGAPKDRFQIENTGTCTVTNTTLELDLSSSQGKLIFDTTGSGAGVEVFQPFEITAGRDFIADVPNVTDGQNAIALSITNLSPGAAISFTIDVDDTLGEREITVTGAEIAGATVLHLHEGTQSTAIFSKNASAEVGTTSC